MKEIISNLLLWDTRQHWPPLSEIITVVPFTITLSSLLSCLTMFLTFSLHFLGQYLCLPVPTQLGFHSRLFRLSRPEFCEMKYFLPYQSARNVTTISHFRAANVNEGSQRGTQYLQPSRWHDPPPWLLRSLDGGGEGYRKQPSVTAAASYSELEIKDVNNQKTGFGPR